MFKIVLISNRWSRYQDANISFDFIGYIDFKGYLYLSAEELASSYYSWNMNWLDFNEFIFQSFLPKANGNFAFIVKNNTNCMVVCDFTRNYPLYIINDNSGIIVTDHIGEIQFKREHDELAQEEFLLSGLVTGNRTVFKNIKGVQAGELAYITDNNLSFHRYFILKSDPFRLNSNTSKQTLIHKKDKLLLKTFERMIKSCPDVNNWIVPLSGGHDSRLIINYLYRLGCKNVICFTYGSSSSVEAHVSKLAAKALDFEWHFVEYTPEEWSKLHNNNLFDRYIKFSFNGCCLPHTQDLLALYKLKELGIIIENDVIIPGHTAFTEAENTSIKSLLSEKQSLKYVYSKYYTLFNCENKFSRFESNLEELYENGGQNMNSFPEFFNWQERQSKFINNSVRAYEFFGLRWRLPFWEKDIIDFWQRIDYDDRIRRNILFTASKNYLFHDNLKTIPIINKFEKPIPAKTLFNKILSEKIISLIVRFIGRKAAVAEGTNNVFALKAFSVRRVIEPLKIYPSNLKSYLNPILPRRPFQVNVNTLTAIYTLRNEVFSESVNKTDEKE